MNIKLKSANVHLYPLVPFESLEKGDKQYVPFCQMVTFRRGKINATLHEIMIKARIEVDISRMTSELKCLKGFTKTLFLISSSDFSICKVTIPVTIWKKEKKTNNRKFNQNFQIHK